MGLSDGDNRASSVAGPATHNHSCYTDREMLNGWMRDEGRAICTIKRGGGALLVNIIRNCLLTAFRDECTRLQLM